MKKSHSLIACLHTFVWCPNPARTRTNMEVYHQNRKNTHRLANMEWSEARTAGAHKEMWKWSVDTLCGTRHEADRWWDDIQQGVQRCYLQESLKLAAFAPLACQLILNEFSSWLETNPVYQLIWVQLVMHSTPGCCCPEGGGKFLATVRSLT